MLSQKVASAGVPPSVVAATIKAATVVAAGQAVATGAISIKVAALMGGVLKTMFLNKIKVATAVLLVTAVVGVGAGGLNYRMQGAEAAAPSSPVMPVPVSQKADDRGVESQSQDLGFYWVDKRLIGTSKSDKARAKSLAKSQALAAIEANLKKLRENTVEKLELQALDKIERAILAYKNVKFLIELLSVEKEVVPFPTDKKQSEKKK
jgi:hypothetical protein